MIKVVQLVCIFFLFFCTTVHALGDDFTVRMIIGDDTIPPTTPSALNAIPVTQTQIDLSWGASTDDYIFGGYQVFRDASQIATTTLTTYSDTGLTASTTYTYFIRAYDSFLNLSSSSDSVATTTLPITPTSTPTTTVSNNGGGTEQIELRSFLISPTPDTAHIGWETNKYAQFELRWGRTSSYELGFVYTSVFTRENTTVITDLRPDTVYQYQLISHDREGRTRVLKTGEFTTLDAIDTQSPANVSHLQAVVFDSDTVRLSWTNPADTDFAYVRIVRNYLFYPRDPYDGYVIYQNDGTSYTDTHALAKNEVQYYSVFSYDREGNSSSGAIVKVSVDAPSLQAPEEGDDTTHVLLFDDVEFVQNGRVIEPHNVAADLPLTVRIAYEKLPEHLKTIIVTLAHPENDTLEFSFLLKIDKGKTYYEATIAPLRVAGVYPMIVSVFDHTLQKLFEAKGSLEVTHVEAEEHIFGVPLLVKETSVNASVTIFFWLLLLLVVLYIFYRLIRDIPVRKEISTSFWKSHTVALSFLFVMLCGTGAYILFSISRFGMFTLHGDDTLAASLLDAHGSLTHFMSIGLGLVTISSALIVLFILLKKK